MPKVKKEDNVLYAGADEWVNTRNGEVISETSILTKRPRSGNQYGCPRIKSKTHLVHKTKERGTWILD